MKLSDERADNCGKGPKCRDPSAYWTGILAFLVVMLPLLPQVSESNVAFVNQWLAALGELIGFLYDPEPTVEF